MLHKDIFIPKILKQVANTQDIDQSTNELLAYIGEECGADRVYIFEIYKETGLWDNTHEWCKEGVTPQIQNLRNIEPEVFDVWKDQFRKTNSVIIYDLEKYKSVDQVMYDILKPQDIHSLIVFPIEFQGEYIGCFGVDNPPPQAIENITGVLSKLQYTLTIMLRHRELTRELTHISFHDGLTNAKNRRALRRDWESWDKNKSIGFVLCDTNGLKIMNDTHGHKAGDKLISDTADTLFDAFGIGNVYRIGGDEFVAYSLGDTKEAYLARVEKMKAGFLEKKVNVSLGQVFYEKADKTISDLLHETDTLMYADKREYYANQSKNDRRKNRR